MKVAALSPQFVFQAPDNEGDGERAVEGLHLRVVQPQTEESPKADHGSDDAEARAGVRRLVQFIEKEKQRRRQVSPSAAQDVKELVKDSEGGEDALSKVRNIEASEFYDARLMKWGPRLAHQQQKSQERRRRALQAYVSGQRELATPSWNVHVRY